MRISYRTGRVLLMLAVISSMLCHGSVAEETAHTILHKGPMPLEMLRADMENGKLTPDFQISWKFCGNHPVHQ
jgi:hypothetical protein